MRVFKRDCLECETVSLRCGALIPRYGTLIFLANCVVFLDDISTASQIRDTLIVAKSPVYLLMTIWDGIEKKFSSGEWVYSSWRRGLGDEKRWVRESIPENNRDGMQIQRQWMCIPYWRYSLVAPDGTVYTLREEPNNCD